MAGQRFSTNLGLSVFPEIDQAKYGSIFSDGLRVRQALQLLQGALDRYTGALGPDSSTWSAIDPTSYELEARISRVYVLATEAIAQGAMVNLYNNSGALGARNANASAAGKPVRAFANAAVAANAFGEFILAGVNPYITGLTPGTTYYLSNTNGVISATTGTITQKIGFSLATNKIYFNPDFIA